ncbi:N-acetylmuramoyl-L-alanine amidase [Marinigracilibium pacificum]|uniref:N-acetylmuramoyl-L-alanine amidase n=1 Tax=Marinigracilibium pacificum TaxID=2729599 RepID=UPI002FE3BBCC
MNKNTIEIIERSEFDFSKILQSLYSVIFSLLICRFTFNIIAICIQIGSSKHKEIKGLKLIITENSKSPHSFFNFLFVSNKYIKDKELFNSILNHEQAHSRQLHSLDIILIELLCCTFWFNPIVWIYKKEVKENHEYLADRAVINSGINISKYAAHIIENIKLSNQNLASAFSFLITKNRINMLSTNNHSKQTRWFFPSIAIIIFATILAGTSFTPKKDNSKPLTVIIDAGHGGKDPGINNEKDINLMIAKHISELSQKSNIKIILSRTTDKFISLEDRVKFINNSKADLLISLHCNSDNDESMKGIEAFYYPEGKNQEQARKLSKLIVSDQVKTITDIGKINTANYKIIRDVKIPGVLIELGFLSNKTDLQRLTDPTHQKEIAQSIYNSIQEF